MLKRGPCRGPPGCSTGRGHLNDQNESVNIVGVSALKFIMYSTPTSVSEQRSTCHFCLAMTVSERLVSF